MKCLWNLTVFIGALSLLITGLKSDISFNDEDIN